MLKEGWGEGGGDLAGARETPPGEGDLTAMCGCAGVMLLMTIGRGPGDCAAASHSHTLLTAREVQQGHAC